MKLRDDKAARDSLGGQISFQRDASKSWCRNC